MKNKIIQLLSGYCIRLSKIHSRKGLYPFLHREFGAIRPEAKVLNIGAGGAIESLLRKYSGQKKFDVTTMDIDPKRSPDVLADVHSWESAGEFDVVVLSEVLEHCYAPQHAIDTVENALVPGGKLILTTPFIFPIHEAPNDYFRFTRFGLAHLLKNFECVMISERNYWSEAILVLMVRLVMEESKLVRLVSPLFIFTAFILWPVAWFFARLLKISSMTTGYVATSKKKSTAKNNS